jgi:hypothetical protein
VFPEKSPSPVWAHLRRAVGMIDVLIMRQAFEQPPPLHQIS